jgi:DNA polymerase III epsilon subunit-like protein
LRSLLVRCEAVPPDVQALTGIDAGMLERDGVAEEQALGVFLAETRDLPLVGHNVLRFDMGFLEAGCEKTGLTAPHRSRYRDTAALYRAHFLQMRPRPGQDHWSFAFEALDRKAPGLRYSLEVCCRELAISGDGMRAHRAAGDVLVTQRLYARLAQLRRW